MIDGYIRNLSRPSNKDGEDVKDYSILAIAASEENELNSIFRSEAFQTCIETKGGREIVARGFSCSDADEISRLVR